MTPLVICLTVCLSACAFNHQLITSVCLVVNWTLGENVYFYTQQQQHHHFKKVKEKKTIFTNKTYMKHFPCNENQKEEEDEKKEEEEA